MILTKKETEINYSNKAIYKKSKAEKKQLKDIKMNLTVPFINKVLFYIGADNKSPLDIDYSIQPTAQQKQLNKY